MGAPPRRGVRLIRALLALGMVAAILGAACGSQPQVEPPHPIPVGTATPTRVPPFKGTPFALYGLRLHDEPTPTPTPVPVPVPVYRAQGASATSAALDGCPEPIARLLGQSGCNVSYCESRWREAASNVSNLDDSHGATQINLYGDLLPYRLGQMRSIGYDVWTRDQAIAVLHTYEGAARVAELISSGGRDWSAWSCGWAA